MSNVSRFSYQSPYNIVIHSCIHLENAYTCIWHTKNLYITIIHPDAVHNNRLTSGYKRSSYL